MERPNFDAVIPQLFRVGTCRGEIATAAIPTLDDYVKMKNVDGDNDDQTTQVFEIMDQLRNKYDLQ